MRVLVVLILIGAVYCDMAWGELPPQSAPAKAQAAEAAAKSAWADKVGAYKTCLATERVAQHYRQEMKAEGKQAPAPFASPPCTDPGPYAAPATTPKPLEASGAHSPADTAHGPPSSNATAKELDGKSKP